MHPHARLISGHVHNFYIQVSIIPRLFIAFPNLPCPTPQNIRNNKNHNRTPKWVQRYGLVDTSEIKRKERRSQWAGRYNDRLPRSTLENQPYEEGQEGGSSVDISAEDASQQRGTGPNGALWKPEEEQFYGQKNRDSGSIRSGRWHYPANFEDTTAEPSRKKSKKKKEKKDRWARTEDAYSIGADGNDGPAVKRKKSSKKKRRTQDESSTYSRKSDSVSEFPEDAEGGLYGESQRSTQPADPDRRRQEEEDIFNQEV